MSIAPLLSALLPAYVETIETLATTRETSTLRGVEGALLPLLLSRLYGRRPVLCLMDEVDEAGYLYSDLVQVLGNEAVYLFPSGYKRAVRYGHRDEANIILRSMALGAIAAARSGQRDMPIIVSTPGAIAELASDASTLEQYSLSLVVGMTLPMADLTQRLYEWGFHRVDYVYEVGQYAVRGGIVDIFSYAQEEPCRVVYDDDDIESIRSFEIEHQLSTQALSQISLLPDVSRLGAGHIMLSLLPSSTLVLCGNVSSVPEHIETLYTTPAVLDEGEGWESTEAMQRMLCEPATFAHLWAGSIRCSYRSSEGQALISRGSVSVQPRYHKDYDALCRDLEEWQRQGYACYIASATSVQYDRVCEIVSERAPHLAPPPHLEITLHEGFVDHYSKVVLLTEHQLFGRYHKYHLRSEKARAGKLSLSLRELHTFAVGDYVVHTDHGVGQFGGLLTMDIGGKPQEVIKIVYKNNDSIYVNVHSLHKLSHYRSRDVAEAVQLSTLGSGAWQRLRERTKKQIKDIARDLIRLYAQRRESEGFAYSPDSYLQHELEASFAYEDTPDQAKAIEDIKADMERPFPMDRLLCGDVGFGKTEVAIRAAFKAATDGKQVALLVPTTVLAYQHYRTFSSRLEGFPVRVDYLSRARSTAETKQILQELAEGKIDIIIGTHKLTGKGVNFRDLGLLIIDEEQKFGVSTKEKLRQLQVNVDTLTMSATPIPRTLQFSLMGARDLSNINTPPPNRRPVETILGRFTGELLREAIDFELSRNGQVYLVHNRVQNIEQVAEVIRREVPDARIAIGHGQMSPKALEQLLIDFGRHEYDVLIATTIIENGIDVPNANTIIINDAHRYGLSELHQLRGRVGRSNRKAFCYLITPPLATLSEDARRRVRAIESFSDLGSGVRIALQDLDIRGAGNALGAEQSGFVADMGYETYQKVFEEAVGELKATEFAHLYHDTTAMSAHLFVSDTLVETDLSLSLPEDYVPQDSERILLYRELDALQEDRELEQYRSRLVDRFGPLPEQVEALILVPKLRRLGRQLGIEKLVLKGGRMSFFLISDRESPYYQSSVFDRLLLYVARHSRECQFVERGGRHIIHVGDVPTLKRAIEVCVEIQTM